MSKRTYAKCMTQDMVFYSDSERVDFETVIDWNDKHRLLKTVFDTSIYADYATQEIQFGNVKRSTKRNNSFEQAQFEVCNHKYSDLSEPSYGVALLNDCRLYEAEGSYTTVTIDYLAAIKNAIETNLLEIANESKTDCRNMTFRPFEIKTIKLTY